MYRAIAVAAALVGSQAAAQGSDWTYSATFYGWVPDAAFSLETPVGNVDGEVAASDLISALDFGFSGVFSAQHGPLGLVADFQYFDMSDSDATHGVLFDSARLESKLTVSNIYALYQVAGNATQSFDIGLGYRFYNTDSNLTLSRAGDPDVEGSSSDNWSDPLIALRYRGNFSDQWYGLVMADYGGFLGSQSGSDSTWQGLAAVGYRFNDSWSTQFGYRYLQVERSNGANNIDITMSGPVIGVTFTF
jgi:hypothetical protein